MRMIHLALPAAFIASVLAATPAIADDRPANAREERRIATMLRANGFAGWEKVKLERKRGQVFWSVDDAQRRDGSKWDLKLRPQSLRIFARERDD